MQVLSNNDVCPKMAQKLEEEKKTLVVKKIVLFL